MLTFKEAYSFLQPPSQVLPWGKLIWNKCIPPSKSCLLWRFKHNRLPTDDHLWQCGFNIVSVCSLCGSAYETSQHLFLHCSFAKKFRSWLSNMIDIQIDSSSLDSVLQVCFISWSSQVQDVLLAAISYVFWSIWLCINNLRFESKKIPFENALNLVKADTSLSGSLSAGSMAANISEFMILKRFSIKGKPPKPSLIKKVNWYPPKCYWIKCNTDGAVKGSPGLAACGGIFKDRSAAILGCFAHNLCVSFALHAELYGAILAIEIAFRKGWRNLWLECDSALAIEAFKSISVVPWRLRNMWLNCMALVGQINFGYSHIYIEGNVYADRLASFGTNIRRLVWWELVPNFNREDFIRNRIGLPSFKFK